MKRKIGLAVIAYRRYDYLKQCLVSLETTSWGGADERIVIVDELPSPQYDGSCIAVEFDYAPNGGVASAKNRGLRRLLAKGCTDLFLMESDILMQRSDTCQAYIDYAKLSGIQHLNFALHGPFNQARTPHSYGGVCCHYDAVGAFSYSTKAALEEVGLLDAHFFNAWEHVEHTFRMANAGLTTPYWEFADIPNSGSYLREIPGSFEGSCIRVAGWPALIDAGTSWWIDKHGVFPPAGFEEWEKKRACSSVGVQPAITNAAIGPSWPTRGRRRHA